MCCKSDHTSIGTLTRWAELGVLELNKIANTIITKTMQTNFRYDLPNKHKFYIYFSFRHNNALLED